jgi:SsrA-binding protein
MKKEELKTIARNKKANHEYFILETYEAGIVLFGTEIKSVRSTKVSIQDAYCEIKNQEMFVQGMHIAPYEKGNIFNHKEERERKLLLHKKEIIKLFSKVKLEGLTIIPLEVYITKGLCKIKIGLCKGKKLFDKRNDLKEKSAQKDIQKNLKVRY